MIKIKLVMEMPENCMECRFHEVDGLFDSCIITDCLFRDDEDKQRNKNCPLEEVENDRGKVDILDKIRDEIKETANKIKNIRNDNLCFFTEQDILEIIDKCRGE